VTANKRLFVGIAVAKPKGMTVLPEVYPALEKMAEFARISDRYDDPILISDEKKDVTSARIEAELIQDVLLDRPRISVYFCGHGAFNDGEEIWYLTDGQNSWRERVNVLPFRDVLATYGPDQISIFSDACQTPVTHPTGGSAILADYRGSFAPPDYDIFRATIRGEAAFADPKDGPLFTKAMIGALNKSPPADALDEPMLKGFQRRIVTNQSLKKYVKRHLPDYAALSGQKQHPELMPCLTYYDNDYLELPPTPGSGGDDDKTTGAQTDRPVSHMSLDKGRSDEDLGAALDDSRSEWREPFWAEAGQAAEMLQDQSRFLVRTSDKYGMTRDDATLRFHPADSDKVIAPVDRLNDFAFFPMNMFATEMERGPSGVLQVEDLFVPLPLGISYNLTFIAKIALFSPEKGEPDASGPDVIGWREVGFGELPTPGISPMQALKGLLNGYLGADTIAPIAASLRGVKHVDPLYGIVAAYLYDRAGDINSIRRLCYFYNYYAQAIPFDIALLSRLPLRQDEGGGFTIDVPAIPKDTEAEWAGLPDYVWIATEARDRAFVSGVTPILRAGWTRLRMLARGDHPAHVFSDLDSALTAAPFSCVRGMTKGEDLIGRVRAVYQSEVAAGVE